MKHVQSCDAHPRYAAGCAPCAQQNRRYFARRTMHGQPLSRPAALTTQRIRELRALGYSLETLVIETGVGWAHLKRLSQAESDWVQLRTFHGVEIAYRRLRYLPGVSARAALVARKHGWTPPEPPPAPEKIDESSVDEIAVERAVAGERLPLTRAESAEAWGRLEKLGLSAHDISLRLHTTQKTVERWRSGQVRRPSSTRARVNRSA